MDEVTYVKNKFRQEQWEKLIADCQSSGLKVDDWYLNNNVGRNAYYYWLRKIRKKACESILPSIPKQNTHVEFTAEHKFHPNNSISRAEAAAIIVRIVLPDERQKF